MRMGAGVMMKGGRKTSAQEVRPLPHRPLSTIIMIRGSQLAIHRPHVAVQAFTLPRRPWLALQQISAASLPDQAGGRFVCAGSRFRGATALVSLLAKQGNNTIKQVMRAEKLRVAAWVK